MNQAEEKLRIALFRPPEEDLAEFDPLRSSFEVELDEFDAGEAIEIGDYDAALVPLKLENGTSGITKCISLRAEASGLPALVVGFCHSKERAVLQAFYDVGADFVFTPPFSNDQFVLQVRALKRRRTETLSQITKEKESSGISHSVMSAFNLSREGLCIFDLHFRPYFLNSSAQHLFGVAELQQASTADHLDSQLRGFLKRHHETNSDSSVSRFEGQLKRTDGQNFLSAISIATLKSENEAPFAFALQITDLSELDLLSANLAQAGRTRSLALLAASGAFHLMQVQEKNVLSPLVHLENKLADSARSCPLNATLTSLLEFLDLVIAPDITVKVNVKKDYNVGMRVSDFFRLLGQIVLFGVEFSGPAGECIASFSEYEPGTGITVLLTARSRKVTPFLPNDYLAEIIQGRLLNIGPGKSEGFKLSSGLAAAQEIASSYRTTIEYQQVSGNEMKVRVRIPIDQRSLQRS